MLKFAQFISFVVFTISHSAYAQKFTQKNQSKVRLTDEFLKKEKSQSSFMLPTFVIHGIQPDPIVAQQMPNKLDGSGDMVFTPGFAYQHVNEDGEMFLGAVVKDCFNNTAATVQFGKMYDLESDFAWGWSFGFYARPTPYICEPGINGKKDCYPVADFPLKLNFKVGQAPFEVMPMPFVHFQYRLVNTDDFKMNLKVIANFFINEVGIEIPF